MTAARSQTSPLTASQTAIWTGQRLQPRSPLYNMALAFSISGDIDQAAFAASFADVVAAADSLRLVFDSVDGVPRQSLLTAAPSNLEFVDLRTSTEPDKAANEWLNAATQRVFDLDQCLYHSALLQVAEHQFVWYLNQHHLITDATSCTIVFQEMARRYQQRISASPAVDSPPLPTFLEQVERERDAVESPLRVKARNHWRNAPSEAAPIQRFYRECADLPGDTTLRMRTSLTASQRTSLHQLADSERFSTISQELARFQLLATALIALLYRITGNETIAIGVPVHNRTSRRTRSMIGLLIEVFPLRVSCQGTDTFSELYERVSEGTREILMNSPPGACESTPARDVQVILNYITATFGEFAGMPTDVNWVHPDSADQQHWLRLQVHEFDQRNETELLFDLNADVFAASDRTTIQQHFSRILDALTRSPEQPLGGVALLAADEALSPESSDLGPASAATVITEFEEQVRLNPSLIAIVGGSDNTSYAQLNQRAESIATHISKTDRSEGPVAILMERSVDCVASILAVLKTGRCYVPIDPAYPVERVQFMLEDSKAQLCLHDESLPADCQVALPVRVSDIATTQQSFDTVGHTNKPAYMIYTSGSTGTPKGVVIDHQNLYAYINWAREHYVRERRMTFALFSSLAFDLTVTSIFTPLSSGGRIAVYPEPKNRSEILIRTIVEEGIADIIKLTPAHLRLLSAVDLSRTRIATLIVGGEDLKTALAKQISAYFDDAIELYNEYGPTEATVACMIHRFDPSRDTQSSVPIGRPIEPARVYVLDLAGNPAPAGVAGEIHIGGRGVARGYWQRPDLTAQRFRPDPYLDGGQLYSSGDLGRWRHDGTMEFLGRTDKQLKIRGVRVEPGEVEAAIRTETGVADIVVTVRDRQRLDEQTDDPAFCERCGLDGRHPHALLDSSNVCAVCRQFEREEFAARAYFRTFDELTALATKISTTATGEYDSMMLLSGGKDSTYALCRLVDLGLKPLVFTLDNGFISEGAKRNMRQVVDRLGLTLVVGETPAMNNIFVESLRRFSNVCDGCFKTIYTLSTTLAKQHGIKHIFTGLSRGQIFQTRVAEFFRQNEFDPRTIDRMIIEARKAYHRADDAVSRELDVSVFENDSIFDEVQYVDFYRYSDVELTEVLNYLENRVPWVRPADTGRSTNCLINEAGIFVHKRQRGHHNYSLPYSWDVRLGHKQRDAARAELDDNIDKQNVLKILREIGYEDDLEHVREVADNYLVAYLKTDAKIDGEKLRDRLAARLPADMVPLYVLTVDDIPLTVNAKVDLEALPDPTSIRGSRAKRYEPPIGRMELVLSRIWSDVLGIKKIGATDNFFDLGGDSILNIQIVTRARRFDIEIEPQQIFTSPTIRELALVAVNRNVTGAEQGLITGSAAPTPIQQRFLTHNKLSSTYAQTVAIELDSACDRERVEAALNVVLRHHDALRTHFVQLDGQWTQRLLADWSKIELPMVELDAASTERAAELVRLAAATRPASGDNLRAAYVPPTAESGPMLLIAIHHLVVDGVSWWILLEDLEAALAEIILERQPVLPPKTSPFLDWSQQLLQQEHSDDSSEVSSYWLTDRQMTSIAPATKGARDVREIKIGRDKTLPLLRTVPARWQVNVPELLLAAMLEPLTIVLGREALQIDIENHGRETGDRNADVLRTVGWFTSISPVALSAAKSSKPWIHRLSGVRDTLRRVPNNGLDYGILKYLAAEDIAVELAAKWNTSPVLFNYLGQWNSAPAAGTLVRFAEPIGLSCDSDVGPRYGIEIDVVVFDGEMRIRCDFDSSQFLAPAITDMLRSVEEALVAAPALQEGGASQVLATTFADSDLSQSELDAVLAEFGE